MHENESLDLCLLALVLRCWFEFFNNCQKVENPRIHEGERACMRVQSLCSFMSNFATPWTVAYQAPLHQIFQARILEWVAIFSSRVLAHISCIASGFFTTEPSGMPKQMNRIWHRHTREYYLTRKCLSTWYSMNEPWKHYAKWNKPDTKRHKYCDSTGGSDGKSVCLQCRKPGFNPWVGKIPWRRKWPLGESHGQRSLVGNRPCCHKE